MGEIAPPTTAATTQSSNWKKAVALYFGLLFLSAVLVILPWPLSYLIFWRDPWLGVGMGFAYVLFFMVIWPVIILPLNVLTLALFYFRKWHRWRALFVLLPSLLILGDYFVELALNFPTVPKRFAREAGQPIPASAKNFRWQLSGGGLADITDIYYFESTPEFATTLVKEHDLKAVDRDHVQGGLIPPLGWPDPAAWPGVRIYERDAVIDENYFYTLMTDETGTRVYLLVYTF